MELNNGDGLSDLLKAHAHVMSHASDFVNSMTLKCAVQLGIPDIIHNHGQPMTLNQLVDALKINSSKENSLHRFMQILVHEGFLTLQEVGDGEDREGYSLTQASCLLLKEHPMSLRPRVLMVLDALSTKPWDCLSTWFQNEDASPFSVAHHGKTLYEYAGQDSEFNTLFNDAMANDSLLVSNVLVLNCKEVFEGLKSLVDVGGGTGATAKIIAETFPNLKCTVFDLPHVVVGGLQGNENLNFMAGDMFESNIPSADAVLLKWILHNWRDEDCVKILKQCREAITRVGIGNGKEGKVMIIDMVMDSNDRSMETQLRFDLQMMVLLGGQERNEKEWAKIFSDAGFSGYKINPLLGPRALIEVFP